MRTNKLIIALLLSLNSNKVESRIKYPDDSPWSWLDTSRQFYLHHQEEFSLGMCITSKFLKVGSYIEANSPHPGLIVKLVSLDPSLDSVNGPMKNSSRNIEDSSKLASFQSDTSERFTKIATKSVIGGRDLSPIKRMDEAILEFALVDGIKENSIIVVVRKLLGSLVTAIEIVATLVKSSIIFSCTWDYIYTKCAQWISAGAN